MRVPNQNLDDFFNNAAGPKPAEPQPSVSLHPSGETEILKPLARWEDFVNSKAAADLASAHQVSWYHRSLAVSGATAVIALILGTGVFFGIYGPPVEPAEVLNDTSVSPTEVLNDTSVGPTDVAIDQQPSEVQAVPEEPIVSDLLPAGDFPAAFDGLHAVRSAVRRRSSRPRVFHAFYRPRRRPLRVPQLVMSEFVPTTLFIYVENGEIKTRIEPQLTAVYKKTSILSN